MSHEVGELVLPGDTIKDIQSVKGLTVVGPGLYRNVVANTLLVTRAGLLCFKEPNFYWIDSVQKQYIPKRGDLIVGIITKKGGDVLKVDIGSSELAALSSFAFEGATKKQKPDLQVGDVVYARLLSAHREMEPELVCVDKYGKAGKLGQLSNDGFIFNVKPNLVYRLLNLSNPLLKTLGKMFPFEIALGMNGKVWVNAKSSKDILRVVNALSAAENQSDNDINVLCREIQT